MLPSTGYFKAINCPFYDSGLCERPYCHFRHVKKEIQASLNDGMESNAILQKLVSAAVQKVLEQQTENNGATTSLKISADCVSDVNGSTVQLTTLSKPTYNPTPISELNKIHNVNIENEESPNEQKKRHIPVPYTPSKPAANPIKRPIEISDSFKPFVFNPPPLKYTPGSTESPQLDSYTPKGSAPPSNEKYLPGTDVKLQEYAPKENNKVLDAKQNYVPSDKSSSKRKILEYKPAKVNSDCKKSVVTYQPTPCSLVPCFSSDEEEPNTKKVKPNDFNSLDDLEPEFDMLDQILDEEKNSDVTNVPNKKSNVLNTTKCKENGKHSEKEKLGKDKHISNRSESNKSSNKLSPEGKSKSSDKESRKSCDDDKKRSDNKNHKSASINTKNEHSKDKHKVKDSKDKHSSGNKKHSDSKSSERHSKSSSSKKADKSSTSEKSKSKDKDYHKSHKKSREKDSKKSKDRHKKEKISKPVDLSDNENNYDADDSILNKSDEELRDFSESDEESIALECKRIFEEYVPVEKNSTEDLNKPSDVHSLEDEYTPGKKRISRTADKNIKVIPKAPIKPDFKVSAAQAMAERLAKVKLYHASKVQKNETTVNKIEYNVPMSPNVGSNKIRIAHVPYASTLVTAKKSITPSPTITKIEPSTSSTIVQTIKKGVQRIAHIPNDKFIDRPGVLEPLASKIAANIRSTYLNMMIDECLKIYLYPTDAYARAQHEELTTSKKCSTVQIYKNSAVLAVSRLRKELQECKGVKKSGTEGNILQNKPNSVKGNTAHSGSWSIENKNKNLGNNSHEFIGAKFYNNIKKWILTEEQLNDNGFPRPHTSGEKGRAIIYGQAKQKPPVGNIRTCCRCKKEYLIDKKGFSAVKGDCIYHPNRKYRVRGEARYQCCSQDESSDGCCTAPTHVYEYVDFLNLKGFVRTLPPEKVMDDYGVYSLDCEMCYTTHGLDLTRVTVINSSCKVIYETLIKPLHPIIDYNTRYSGITEEQMADVKTTLLDVQATLLTMFNSKSILIGHSLESDFKALKLIHDTVIDTSVLFPHKMGPPFKRALRNLSSDYLKKIIQNSVEGHDSAEDATVCMELLHYKLKEDLKTR